jgi:hypothetical protein
VGDQKILFIFVDDDGAGPWTVELRQPVEIKIERSLRWLENKAQAYGIQLRLKHVCIPRGSSVACHASENIDETDYCAGPGHSTWQNRIVTGLTSFGSVASCWNDLFKSGGLPLYGTEGSAVVFCVRRYVPSVAFPFFEGQNDEFERERAIIYDNGGEEGQLFLDSQIAHELLHLYGAVDLAPDKTPDPLKKFASQYSDDVMHTPTQRAIESYCISDLTAYLVGWRKTKPAFLAQTTNQGSNGRCAGSSHSARQEPTSASLSEKPAEPVAPADRREARWFYPAVPWRPAAELFRWAVQGPPSGPISRKPFSSS